MKLIEYINFLYYLIYPPPDENGRNLKINPLKGLHTLLPPSSLDCSFLPPPYTASKQPPAPSPVSRLVFFFAPREAEAPNPEKHFQ